MALPTYDTIAPQGDYPATTPSKTISNKVINQNGGNYVRFWFGTQAEYDALSSIEEDVCYSILEE